MAREEEAVVREVWGKNMMEELPLILEAAAAFPFVALDTEFPGFLRHTPRFASPEERYQDVKYNVDRMKLIQIGLTFFGDSGGHGGRPVGQRRRRLTWQINLSDFDVSSPTDARWEASIELLRGSGVDLEKTRNEGVDSEVLSDVLMGGGWMASAGAGNFAPRPSWVTFHGIYDLAYLLKLLTQSSPLPETLPGFVQLAGETLGSVFDAKHVAGFCGGQCRGGNLGLAKLSEVLQVQPATNSGAHHHQAGYDSLLTAMVFEAMIERFHLPEDALEGFIYGLEQHRILPHNQEEHDADAMAEDDDAMSERDSLDMIERFHLPEDALEGFIYGLEQHRIPPQNQEEHDADATAEDDDAMSEHDSLDMIGGFHAVCGAHCWNHGQLVGFEVPVAPPTVPALMLPPPPFGYINIMPAAVAGDEIIFFY